MPSLSTSISIGNLSLKQSSKYLEISTKLDVSLKLSIQNFREYVFLS